MSDEVYFLHANKNQSFLQVDIIFFDGLFKFLTGVTRHVQVPKMTILQYFKNDMLYYLDIPYMHRPPSHTQSIQNNKSTISQERNVKLS